MLSMLYEMYAFSPESRSLAVILTTDVPAGSFSSIHTSISDCSNVGSLSFVSTTFIFTLADDCFLVPAFP